MKKLFFLFSILFLTASFSVKLSAQTETKVPFTIMKGYFVKNNVKSYLYQQNKFEFANDFEKVFGLATTMSSKPTSVNFSKQFVLAVVEKPSHKNVEITPISLVKNGNTLVLKYQVVKGKTQSSISQPAMLLVVNKKYDGNLQVIKVK